MDRNLTGHRIELILVLGLSLASTALAQLHGPTMTFTPTSIAGSPLPTQGSLQDPLWKQTGPISSLQAPQQNSLYPRPLSSFPNAAFGTAIVGDALPQLWHMHLMPDGLLYSSYLAGPRESRLGTAFLSDSDGPDVWDTTLGARVGLIRWGTADPLWPEGWQLDVEGAAFPRLNLDENEDVDGTDFRFGIPLTYRIGPWQTKAAFYHLSSHAGDEFIERNPTFQRINFSRNAVVLGVGYFATPNLRFYAEADYGFDTDGGADPWWFQLGFDLAPSQPTGLQGAPFVAANAFLREEVDFGGTLTLMAGWAWRADRSGHLCRAGLQYSTGHTTQLEFHKQSEQLIGIGIWYDF